MHCRSWGNILSIANISISSWHTFFFLAEIQISQVNCMHIYRKRKKCFQIEDHSWQVCRSFHNDAIHEDKNSDLCDCCISNLVHVHMKSQQSELSLHWAGHLCYFLMKHCEFEGCLWGWDHCVCGCNNTTPWSALLCQQTGNGFNVESIENNKISVTPMSLGKTKHPPATNQNFPSLLWSGCRKCPV